MEIRSSLPNIQAYNTATQNAAVEPRQAEQTRQSNRCARTVMMKRVRHVRPIKCVRLPMPKVRRPER